MAVRPKTATPRRRKPGVKAAIKLARQEAAERKLQQRARLINAGVVVSKRRAKFNQVATTYRGERYDSLGEAEYADKLNALMTAGKIVRWERPKPIILVDGPKARDRVTYKPDFVVWISSSSLQCYYVDYKGSKATETAAWKIKVKIWRTKIPYELRVAYPTGEEKVVAHATIGAV